MADGISISITEDVTKVEVTEDVTTINITPSVTTVEAKGISIANAGAATAMTYQGTSNTLGTGGNVAASLDHINTNGLNKNLDQTIDGNITFADGHTITFPDSGYTALELNDNSMNVAGITASADITSATKMEAPLFKGDLEGAVHFKASGSGLAKGDVVYISGYQGQRTTVAKADASDSAKMPAFGIVNATQGNNKVDVLTFGSMLHLSTTGIATGTELYVSASTPGSYETSAPTGEGNLVQKIAKVVRGDSNSGSIKIMGAGRTNATPNLNDGNIFLGNSSNIPTTASFDTTFASSFATRTTTDLSEGTNLYYTDARADARVDLQTGSNLDLSQKTTTDLTEGTNLYYTDARVNDKLGTGVDNIVTTGYLRGPSTFTIDPAGHGDNTGKVVIAGDLQVDGTTTTLNSTELTIDDKVIEVASNATNTGEANGAGLSVGGTSATLTYTALFDGWTFNKSVDLNGNLLLSGGFFDSNNSNGTAGQALLSTGTATEWGDISTTLNVEADSGDAQTIEMLTENLDIAGGTGISTATTDNTVTVKLDDTAVTAATYGGSQTIPQITVDDQGRITGVTNITGQTGPTGATGPLPAGSVKMNFTTTSSIHAIQDGEIAVSEPKYSQVRSIRIAKEDASGTDITDFVRNTTTSSNFPSKGYVTITKISDPSKYLVMEMLAQSGEVASIHSYEDTGNYILVPVDYVAGTTGINPDTSQGDVSFGFGDESEVAVSFVRAADQAPTVHGLKYLYHASTDLTASFGLSGTKGHLQWGNTDLTTNNLKLRIAHLDYDEVDQEDFIRHITSSTASSKGFVTVINRWNRDKSVTFKITDNTYDTTNTHYTVISLEHIIGSTTISDLNTVTPTVHSSNIEYDILFEKGADHGDIDAHIGTSSASNNEVLSWTGSAYDWVPQSGGIALSDISVNGTENTAAGDGGIAYDNSTGVFTYTPPDLSAYLTSYTETDPIVGGITGIVKSDGLGTISAAVGGTSGTIDYSTVKIGDGATDALAGNTALLALGTTIGTALEGNTKIEELYTEVDTGLAGVEAGKAYRISGWDSTNNRPVVTAAISTSSLPVIGFATETVSAGQTTKLLVKGLLTDIDTSLLTMGGLATQANLFPSNTTAGTLTRVPDDDNSIQSVASVVVVSTNGVAEGVIMVDVSGPQHFKSLAEDKVLVGNASSEPVATDLDSLVPKIVPIFRKSTVGNINSTDFKALANKRTVISTSGTYEIFQPVALDIGKTWTLLNTHSGTIVLDFDTQYIEALTGQSRNPVQTDWAIQPGGIIELVCINNISNGGSTSTPNFLIYGTGLTDL